MTETSTREGTAPGRLYMCATPIGNLEDVSLRLLRVLREVSLIAAEDTRQTRRLLTRYGVRTPLLSCNERNEAQRAAEILARLRAGRSVAYVTDAGTPGLADPGSRLVRTVRDGGMQVIPVPGPSAVTAALSVSGFAADSFRVAGFLPRRGKRRRETLERLAEETVPVVLFEAPHRIEATLADLAPILSDRPVWIGRELTKAFETTYAGKFQDVRRSVLSDPVQGEYTLVIGPAESPEAEEGRFTPAVPEELPLVEEVNLLVRAGLAEREAIRRVARAHLLPRRSVYQLVKVRSD